MVEQERISALMDGEAPEHEWDPAVNDVSRDPEHARTWQLYHLIGDVMRGDTEGDARLVGRVSEVLDKEPTVLAPQPHRRAARPGPFRSVAFPIAASVAGVAVVAWLALQAGMPGRDKIATGDEPRRNERITVTERNDPAVNDYLMAHQEYSPTTAMHGVASYIRTVSDNDR